MFFDALRQKIRDEGVVRNKAVYMALGVDGGGRKDVLGLSRNPYDKIGHFFQAFVPALVAHEILRRGDFVRGKKMLAFVLVCIVLAICATQELIEWGAALALVQGADEFLGTQGDSWDTQSDMFFALIGATSALLLLTRLQDHQIQQLQTH